ncbi:MAG: MBL fold metallo-hydrolase [Sphingobacteriales bacterium]|nr:MAG: MBL fold metallo-hydrolase [Sphingobacteriales bacterium]
MKQSDDNRLIPMTSVDSGKLREVTADVAYYTNQIVNLVFIGQPGDSWVLVDAGMPKSGTEIIEAAEARFGTANPPAAILLTHGHFDHIGSIIALAEHWKVPVYAHPLEFPYLTGAQAYPEPDATVEGGLLAKIAAYYPNEPIDIREVLQPLPADGTVPGLPDWQWIHVPGHAPGQVAFFRKSDQLLLAADAFVTVQQDSLYKVLVQKTEVCGPPVYFTTDWKAAHESVLKLAGLQPETVISGHGTAMTGTALREGLQELLDHWNEVAVPDYGKWVPKN